MKGRKIRLENPRWRLILIQGVIDHVTRIVLHKAYTDAAISLFQETSDEIRTSDVFGMDWGFQSAALAAPNPSQSWGQRSL